MKPFNPHAPLTVNGVRYATAADYLLGKPELTENKHVRRMIDEWSKSVWSKAIEDSYYREQFARKYGIGKISLL